MTASLEFLLGLLECEPAVVAQEDFEGAHGEALRLWQQMGFVGKEPGRNRVTSCPHCGEGVPYRIAARYVCPRCGSQVDPRHLLLWPVDREVFLRWLAEQLHLRGGVRRIDDHLWQLGTWEAGDVVSECFYRRPGPLSDVARKRLTAYRNAVVLFGVSLPDDAATRHRPSVSLLELLRLGESLTVLSLERVLHKDGSVRFDPESGALWAGDVWLGEVPRGSKEFSFLECLAAHLDSFVPYADLKHFVLHRSGSTDETEEATFCQGLKSRIKKKWVPKLDQVIATTNKADGYRLRGHVELS
jgi:hypothetical protein